MATKKIECRLALTPQERARLTEARLMGFAPAGPLRPGATVPTTRMPWGRLRELARDYLAVPYRPFGYAKQFAAEHGVPYVGFITAVSKLRAEREQSLRATQQENPYDPLTEKKS